MYTPHTQTPTTAHLIGLLAKHKFPRADVDYAGVLGKSKGTNLAKRRESWLGRYPAVKEEEESNSHLSSDRKITAGPFPKSSE